ncbi:hypothetical protein EUX98_g2951 [Antrodiella citrinella]|uniref:Fungal-type protein kinase domain-containing protein n=1 Tax=Antrodiella citrinella TaxID=2447956 RepID=A0A4S4MXR2_9APHY|nr:hypothetical protein EUX98_g2951 [Antrodiella citrinella]
MMAAAAYFPRLNDYLPPSHLHSRLITYCNARLRLTGSDQGLVDPNLWYEYHESDGAGSTGHDVVPLPATVQHYAASLDENVLGLVRRRVYGSLNRHSVLRRVASAMSVFPNPVRPKPVPHSSRRDGSYANGDIVNYLHGHLSGKVIRGYPVVDFISAVYGFKKEDLLKDAPPLGYNLPRHLCHEYSRGTYTKHSRTEDQRSAYVAVLDLLDNLAAQLDTGFRKGRGSTGTPSLDLRGVVDEDIHGQFSNFHPDFMSCLSGSYSQLWQAGGHIGELKKDPREKRQPPVTRIDLDRLLKKKISFDDPFSNRHELLDQTPTYIIPAGKKRKADEAPQSKLRALKRRRLNHAVSIPGRSVYLPMSTLTENEMQAVKYVHELSSHGIRSYASGFLIDDYEMTLYYMDRMGVVASAPFDIFEEPHILLLYLAATRYASPKQLGIFPFLTFPDGIKPRTLLNYPRVKLSIPNAKDINSNILEDVVLSLDISADRKLINTHDAVGRATIVIPVNVDGIVGHTSCGTGKTMCKISWQSLWRIEEDSYVRAVTVGIKESEHESIRKCLKHIVEMKCAGTGTMEEMMLPRAFMGLPANDQTDRVCRMIVMSEYLPLSAVKNVEEFKAAFIGSVKGHHAAYVSSNILHRDVSANNIMFYRSKDEGAVGVLCDWDLAKHLTQEDITMDIIVEDTIKSKISKASSQAPSAAALREAQPTIRGPVAARAFLVSERESRCRTGTGPFMALDLLRFRQVPQHLYRYDMESFFYVLVWFIASFQPASNTLGYIDGWLLTDFEQLGINKAEAIRDRSTLRNIFAKTDDEYRPLVDSWVIKLNKAFMKPILKVYEDIYSEMDDAWEESPGANEQEMIALVKDMVRPKVVARDAVLTYESFMAVLGEQV